MKVNRLFLLVVLLLGVSCNTFANGLTPPTQLPFPIPAYIPPGCQSSSIATVPAVATVAKPTPEVEANLPLTKTQQLNVFVELVSIIDNFYLYPDFNGVDWKGIVDKSGAKVQSGLDTEAFYTEMNNLVSALGDKHSQFESPVHLKNSNTEFTGVNNFVGIGVIVKPMLEKGRLSIQSVFPGFAAQHGGLKPHDSLLALDGLPLIKNGISFADRLPGPACSAVRLTVQSPGGEPRDIVLIRYEISVPESINAHLIPTTDGSRIGYIFIPTFFNETIPGQIKQALNDFGPLDGLVLDNRMNGGGSSNVAGPILSYFTSGALGEFIGRREGRPLVIQADPINNSQTVPLTVLVGRDTLSFGEIFAGILQDDGRAKIVGQTTPGKVETLIGHDLSDGSRVWIAQERINPAHSHANWEQTGIVPDVQAFADWDTFTSENDPGIKASLELFGHN